MKKTFLIFLLSIPLFFSFISLNNDIIQKNDNKTYNQEEFVKRLSNNVDAANEALKILQKNDPSNKYIALVTTNIDANNKFGNSIIISIEEENQTYLKDSCKLCGVSSAYSYLKQIQKDESLGKDFTVRVQRSGDCVNLSW